MKAARAIILKIGSMSLRNKWPISLAMTTRHAHNCDKIWRLPDAFNLPNIKRISFTIINISSAINSSQYVFQPTSVLFKSKLNKFSIQLHHQIIVHGYFRITIQYNLSIDLTKYFQREWSTLSHQLFVKRGPIAFNLQRLFYCNFEVIHPS